MRVRPSLAHLVIACAHSLVLVCVWAGFRLAPESAPAARGAAYAQQKACIDCHGDPDRPLLDASDESCSNTNVSPDHPDYATTCADALAYFETIRLRRTFAERAQNNFDNPLIAGESLARKYHCFQCHGYLGQGGFENARSLKGYVPGYFGADFRSLTRNADPQSVRAWLRHGRDETLIDKPVTGPIARFFFDRQAVSMPSYRSLAPGEIEVLSDYVLALHRLGPMTASGVRRYDRQSRLPYRQEMGSEE